MELTSLRKELGVNVFKVLLIHHSTRTLLVENKRKMKILTYLNVAENM